MAKKAKNNKVLPLIMLPISMILAGIVKLIICNIPEHIYLIFSMEAFNNDSNLYSIFLTVCFFIGRLAGLLIIVLAALSCKGLTKKLLFIASACAGNIAYMFVPGQYNLQKIIDFGIPEWGYSVANIVSIIINSLAVVGCFILSVVIGTLLFKNLSSYEPAPLEEGKKAFSIKKMLLPCGLIIGVLIIEIISFTILPFIATNISDYAVETVVNIGWNLATTFVQVAVLLGSVFIIKDKYRTLTCLGAACIGYFVADCGFLNVIRIIIESIVGKAAAGTVGTVVSSVFSLIVFAGTIVFGIASYIILNRKEMKKINKTEN